MFSRKILAVAAAATLVVGLWACQKKTEEQPAPKSGAGGGIAWMGYTDGMNKAKAEHKPVMVDFYTSWCKYCKMLDETTYQDPGVIDAVNKGFVAIKVNAEGTDKVMDNGAEITEKDLAAKYNVTGYPTIWFFDADGKPIAPLPGYRDASEFTPVLSYITSGSYAKGIDYGAYLKTLKK